ncbi:MAG TPA: sugar ABC transporter substrate-binding protein [Firmicutes bacterium]|jgi:ribose transport system substrate-binding protein|nr:sugar ABC transporter substrate-binding protein [Bacillota bacterium]
MRLNRLKKLPIVIVSLLLVFSLASFSIDAKQKKERVFAIVDPLIHPFFEPVGKGAEDVAKKYGAKILVKGPDRFDVQQQIEIVENLIAMKVDGIGIGSTDPKALTPVINKAMKAGIKVVCFDTDAPESQRLDYIGTDNVKAGQHMGEVLAKLLKGKGAVIASQGIPSQLNLRQRLDGVTEVLKKYPNIKMVDVQSGQGDPSKTLANIEDMVRAHPDFNALLGFDAAAGPAAVTAWKAKGLKQIVITFDDMAEILQGVRDGQITVTIVQQQYQWGKLIVQRLSEACDGKKIPQFEDTGTREVTIQNVDTYNK